MQESEKTMLISERPPESHAGEILLLPIAILAFWTLAYDFALILRWPANTITWCFLAIAFVGFYLLGRVWRKTNGTPGNGYRFHVSHLLLLIFGLAYAITVLFVRRPNQDDVVYFHRGLTQLSHSTSRSSCVRRASTWMQPRFHQYTWQRVMRC